MYINRAEDLDFVAPEHIARTMMGDSFPSYRLFRLMHLPSLEFAIYWHELNCDRNNRTFSHPDNERFS